MDSLKLSWKEGFLLALAWELRSKDGASYPMNSLEKWSSWYLAPVYKTLDWSFRNLRKPMTIVLLTLAASLIIGLAFYNIFAFILLEKLCFTTWIRFLFFIYVETIILAMGCKAFGRFHNTLLVSQWKYGKLTPRFPGNQEI